MCLFYWYVIPTADTAISRATSFQVAVMSPHNINLIGRKYNCIIWMEELYIMLKITMTRKSGKHLHATYGALNGCFNLIRSHHYIYIYIYICLFIYVWEASDRIVGAFMGVAARTCSILLSTTKTIQVRRTRHAGHCWRSRDELISDVLLWTPAYGQAKAGWPARMYIQQLCEDTECSPEDLPEAMNDWEKWRERVRDIRASGTTWWWGCMCMCVIDQHYLTTPPVFVFFPSQWTSTLSMQMQTFSHLGTFESISFFSLDNRTLVRYAVVESLTKALAIKHSTSMGNIFAVKPHLVHYSRMSSYFYCLHWRVHSIFSYIYIYIISWTIDFGRSSSTAISRSLHCLLCLIKALTCVVLLSVVNERERHKPRSFL